MSVSLLNPCVCMPKRVGASCVLVTFIGLPWVTVKLGPASAVWEFVVAASLPHLALRSFKERSWLCAYMWVDHWKVSCAWHTGSGLWDGSFHIHLGTDIWSPRPINQWETEMIDILTPLTPSVSPDSWRPWSLRMALPTTTQATLNS